MLLLGPATPTHAQQSPITVDVVAGFAGAYRINEWFPVRVTIGNDGPDVRGRLEWRFANDRAGAFQQEIDLPRGSRKQVVLNVTTEEFVRAGQVVLSANGADLFVQDVRLEALANDQLLIAVASSDPALLNSLNGLTPAQFSGSVVQHVDLASIPTDPQTLRGVNILFLHDLDTAALSEQQRRAIDLWVHLGGQLVVSGGSNGTNAAAGVANLLPVEVTNNFQQASLTPLASATSGDITGLPTDATLSQVTPRAGAEGLLASAQGPALLYRQSLGNGTTTFSTFDMAALRGWRGEPQLWEQVLTPTVQLSLGGVVRQQRANLLSEVLRLRALTLLPASALLGVLALYVLAIGPVNYLLLRRLKRLEWAWLSIPLVVVGFVAGIYITGRLLRGNETRLVQVAVVQGFESTPSTLITSYNGLFSPNRARYTFAFPPESLINELQTFDDVVEGGGGVVVSSDSGTELRDTLVDIGAIRTILSENLGETDIRVESDLSANGDTIRGEVRYNGSAPLEDAVVVRGRAYQALGELAPGAAASVDLLTTNSDFPWSIGLSEQLDIDRQQFLSRLVEMSEFSQSLTDQNGVYLVGWRGESTTGLRINGREATPEGVTLYVIRLNTGST